MAKKKRRKHRDVGKNAKDRHHILFQRRHYSGEWENALRNHEYCIMRIPRNTLHRQIHEYLADIDAPGDEACKNAYMAIESWLEAGYISKHDSLVRRIEILEICFKAKHPATADALERQKQIALAYYSKPP